MKGDLISRSALLEFAHNHVNGTVDCNDIARFPSVDAEPIPHGYWEVTQKDCIQCSECHAEWAIRDRGEFIEFEVQEDLKWCPSCGAKMDAEVNT